MSVALSVVFTGLCALVTDGDRARGQILLVDAKGIGAVGGVVLPDHAPTLVASLGALANASTSRPTRILTSGFPGPLAASGSADQIGLWDLAGAEVRVRIQGVEGAGLELYAPASGETPWPQPPRDSNDPASWRDLRFVASMKALTGDGRIDPALVASPRDPATGLPRAVATRIHLDAGRLEAGIPSQELYRDEVFEFRGSGAAGLRQALTDTIRWNVEVDAAALVVEIVPVDGGPAKRLVFTPGASPHAVFVSNLPAESLDHDAHQGLDHEQVAALHFGAYYKLLLHEPKDQPLPWPVRAPARKATGMGRTAFCGVALFSRN
jgi:hypothetical protein